MLKGSTIYGGVIDSGMADGPDVLNLYAGVTMPTPMEGLLLGLCYDYRENDDGDEWDSTHAYAFGGYISWQISPKLKLNTRGEYVKGSNGTWVFTGTWNQTVNIVDDEPVIVTNFIPDHEKNELLGVTVTLDYSLWANVLTRVEFRWDNDLSGSGVFNDYIPGRQKGDDDAFQVALNVIYKF